MENDENKQEEAIRVQYTSITQYLSTVVTFRFTIIGLYLAAVGFILSKELSLEITIILLVITLSAFMLELRNRSLYENLTNCGMLIERKYWSYVGDKSYDAFYSHMMKIPPQKEFDPHPIDRPRYDKTWIINRQHKITFPISHTLALDFLYLSMLVFTLIKLIGFIKL